MPTTEPCESRLCTQTATPEAGIANSFLIYELGILTRLTTAYFAKRTGAVTSKKSLSETSQAPEVQGEYLKAHTPA